MEGLAHPWAFHLLHRGSRTSGKIQRARPRQDGAIRRKLAGKIGGLVLHPVKNRAIKHTINAKNVTPSMSAAETIIAVWMFPATSG